ncbi:alpha/beta fold hydrolase [Streptomyces corynorhini]|uniref:Alpha/beta fold hydrolase n=1 Tax=Streptomyces corynorhini TaxID=2282652 RepID=A0A370B4R9_9ACTN|nr:alpha/beta fold hydrolase [Streptomyces corynorhini]
MPDGAVLAVRHWPGPAKAPLVVVWPALGVRARYYRRFAAALVAHGLGVAVVDLRGYGDSLPRPDSSARYGYHELATVDFPAVFGALRERAPGSPVFLLGHSIGGQIGLMYAARNPADVAGILLVAAGTPHFRTYPGVSGLIPLLGTNTVAAVARLRGYWPGDVLRFAGRQSRVLVGDWARMARTGRYRPVGADIDYEELIAAVRLPVLAVSVGGDLLAPPGAVDALCGLLRGATVSRWHHGERLGHTGWANRSAPIAAEIRRWIGGTLKAHPSGEPVESPGEAGS